ncbi:hypothetical protein [Aliarcobacter butzleri]|uniref:hypothetical protein n=1 Tax=Aliarcobacter butzleri TaxID=28197 RepID=UPI002B2544AD|nr:hypothetical protein [Aliarcobacter butzleri]
MSAKIEIERRLRAEEYKRISKILFNKSFDDLSNDEYIEILKIADRYGSKYKRFYKLKPDTDIRTITSNLIEQVYTPHFTTHVSLKIINLIKTVNSFTIYSEFYTEDDILVDIEIDGETYKKKQSVFFRRIMLLEKKANSNYLIISIDPTGDGSSVYKKLEENISSLSSIINLNINSYFDIIKVDDGIHKLILEDKIVPTKVLGIDESTKRVKSVCAGVKDNLKDDDIYSSCKDKVLELENMKLKFDKEGIELFKDTLLKISTRASQGVTDELTNLLIPIL